MPHPLHILSSTPLQGRGTPTNPASRFERLDIAGLRAQHGAQIHCVFIAKAQQQTSLYSDPHTVANRDKMFPDGEAPSLSMYGLHPLEKQGIAFRM